MDKNQSSSSDGTAVSTSKVKEGSSHTDPSPPQKPLAELSVSSIPSDPKPLAEQDKSSTSLKGQTKGSEEGKVIIESSKSTPTTLSDSGEMTPEKSKKIEISKASESSKSKDRRDSSDSGEEQSGTSRLKGKGQEMKGKAKKRFVAKKTESKKPVTEEKKEKVETVLELDLEFPEEARIPLTIKHPNIIEYTMFANFDSFMCACYKGELRLHHLLPMDKMFSAKTCYDQLVAASDFAEPVTTVCLESAALKPDALWKELLFAFHRFIIHILLIQIGLVITFTAPIYIVRNLILSVMRPPPTPAAYYWCIGLFVSSLCYSILVNHLHYRMFCGGLQQRAALLTALYRKCLTVNTNARRRFTTGDILNFASVDILQLFQFTQVCGNMVGIPTRMLIGFCITFNLLGPAVIGMFCALLVLMPLSIYIVIKLDCVNRDCMLEKDKRLNVVSEVMEGIKIIKLFGWEIAFSKKIDVFRDSESHILKKFIMLELVGNVVWNSSPFLIVIATFGVLMFWDAKYQLTADVTFAILMLVGTLRAYLTQLPTVISRFVQARVALKRIESFLHCDDMLENVDHLLEDDGLMIDIRNASFSWGKSIVLKNINLQIKRGELVAVLGPVGSGKSSLMSAILDEMNVHSGKIAVRDAKIAYVPQEAWLQEGSIRQNILFQYGLDKRRYSKVITKCCLEPDLKMFKLGDSSEVGERGMLLSGGQKQRVSIARAVYSQAELNLFDDPLSALDSAVAEKVFRGVISNSGMLKGTTRLLATHNTALLPYCDRIIVLEAGAIMHIGSFEDLKTKLDLRKVCRTETTELTDIQSTRVLSFLQIAASDAKATNTSNDKRLRAEDAANATGIRSWSVYLSLAKYIGIPTVIFSLLGYVAYRGLDVGSNLWIRKWVQRCHDIMTQNLTIPLPERIKQYNSYMTTGLGVYTSIGTAATIFMFFGFLLLSLGCHRAAFNMHNDMLKSVMRAPLNFFDTTPIGRIINRFSNDVSVLDLEIHRALDDFIAYLFAIFGCLLLVIYQIPIMAIFFIPAAIAFIFVRRVFLEAARKSRRLALISLSPVLNAFSEAMLGVSIIRAFQAQEMLLDRNHLRVNVSQSTFLHSLVTIRWATIRIDFINAVVVLIMCLLLVYNSESLGPGRVGLLVSYTMTVTRFMSRFVESSTVLEGSVVSAERIIEYADLASEASWTKNKTVLPAVWPSEGLVEFKNYSTRYGNSPNFCLKDLNLRIPPGHKVGVVGRTGAGKSSLTLALFRILEPVKGQILIDGVDTTLLGLHELRKRLTIIPQDPILFRGTLRSNLDPDGEFSEENIERAARAAHLRHDLHLDTEITDGGGNLSLGERQLICLGRALLRKSKVLVLDEATAAVDLRTDLLIQTTIRDVFRTSTVITVAHRLLTILDYDMVIVMAAGEIIERGKPLELIEDTKTQFYKMARDARLVPED